MQRSELVGLAWVYVPEAQAEAEFKCAGDRILSTGCGERASYLQGYQGIRAMECEC